MHEKILEFRAPGDGPLFMWFEPWAEGHAFAAGSAVEVRAVSAVVGELEVVSNSESTTLYAWTGSTLAVFVHGVEVLSFSTPAPGGLSAEMVNTLFGEPPTPTPGEKDRATRLQSSRLPMCSVGESVDEISTALDQAGLPHESYHDCVHLDIYGDTLEVKFWQDGTDSVQLMDGDFHTHLEILALEYGTDVFTAFASWIRDIQSGKVLVVEELLPGGVPRKRIESSLALYLQYLPREATYRVLNQG